MALRVRAVAAEMERCKMLAQVIDVSLYEPTRPDPTVQFNVRIPASMKKQLEAVVSLWIAMAKARGDAFKHIDVGYVTRRLFTVGVEQAFDEYGGIPESQADWEKVYAAVAKSSPKQPQKR